MNKKYLKWLQLCAVGVFVLYAYFMQDKQLISQPKRTLQEQIQPNEAYGVDTGKKSSYKQVKTVAQLDYDFVMSQDAIGPNRHAPVDYYMLVLSWSPAFCQSQLDKYGHLPSSSQLQCGTTRQYGWVIHGLWAQNSKARSVAEHPRFCQGDLPPLAYSLIEQYLPESPSPNLLQGEWEKHGSCAFSDAVAYFSKQQELFKALDLPNDMLPRKELFRWLKQRNPQLRNVHMRANSSELFICYDINWKVMSCPIQ